MIVQFVVGCSKTINLGNYQSLRVEATVTVAVAEGETIDDLKGNAQQELKRLLEDTYRAQYKGAEYDATIA